MSGDIEPRSGTKLRKQRRKSKNSGMLIPELDIKQQDKVLGNGGSNSDVKNVVAQGFCQCCKFDGSTTTTKSKLNKKSTSKKLPKVPKAAKIPRQQFYYEDLSDEDVYNYDIASPSSRESCISICFKSFVLVAIVGSIGFGGLYFHNPTEFWTTMDQVEAYMKPLGANAMWPDFQGIQKNLNSENVYSVLKSSCEYWDTYIGKPFKEHVVKQVLDLTTQTMAFIIMPFDSIFTEKEDDQQQLLTEEEKEVEDERLTESEKQQLLGPAFEVQNGGLPVLPAEDIEIQESENESEPPEIVVSEPEVVNESPPPLPVLDEDVDEVVEEPPIEPVVVEKVANPEPQVVEVEEPAEDEPVINEEATEELVPITEPVVVEKVANPEPTNKDSVVVSEPEIVVSEQEVVVEVDEPSKIPAVEEDPVINDEDDIIEPEFTQKNTYNVGNESLK